jgi:hypothetical protein
MLEDKEVISKWTFYILRVTAAAADADVIERASLKEFASCTLNK